MIDHDGSGVDLSMYLYGVLQQKLVTRDTALAFACALLKDKFGAEELALQEPITISEDGDTWVVSGSRQPNWDDGRPSGAMRRGKAEVVISQFDGRILKFTVDAPIAPLSPEEYSRLFEGR
jgi:NTF2 fold immunity protein